MKVISVNVGLPRSLATSKGVVQSGIVKTPVQGPVRVATLNLAGDRQADLTVHGGVDKAVYAYPSENYPFWEGVFGENLPWGAFGENLTITGLDEESASIGDEFGIGTSVLAVSQPRLPCFKLAAKFRSTEIIKQMLESRRTGFYLRVLREGVIESGDPIVALGKHPARLTIREITDIYLTKTPVREDVRRVLSVDALAVSWRNHFLKLLSDEKSVGE
jgi:MOSC domain-containing protein YiiM